MTRNNELLDSYRWVMLVLFLLLSLVLWIAWFAQAPLLEEYWGKVFHLSAATTNLLLSLPGLLAVFLGVSTGRWTDVLGTKNMLGIGAICGLIGFGLRPFLITSFWSNAVLTVIGGYSICCLTACLAPLMIQWFGHESAHTFIGIGAGSFFIGGGLGIVITAALAGPLGIKNTFLIYSVLILIVAALWWILARGKEVASQAAKPGFADEFKNVMQTPSAWVNLLFAVFLGGATVFTMGFLPMQMAVAYKLPHALAGTIAGLFPIAMGAGLIFLPGLAGRWGKRTTALIMLIITLVVWLIYMSTHNWSIGGLIIVAIIFGLFFEVPWALGMAIQEALPGVTATNMGVAGGAYTVGTNIGVFLLPLIMGGMVDKYKLAGGMWAILITYLLGLVMLLIVREKNLSTT